nr:class IV adenylate cyclase [Candidatus Bipolaricaulota bacterium]
MGRNVEIKARIADMDELIRRVAALAGAEAERIDQEDTFFRSARGRLKLRAFADGSGQLIYYERPDLRGPKTSKYSIAPTRDAAAMYDVLSRSLGVRAVIRKVRRLFLVGQTRVHIDRVDGLGDFLELEVVLGDEQDESQGTAIAAGLMEQLAVDDGQLVHGAYVDLIEAFEGSGKRLDEADATGKL